MWRFQSLGLIHVPCGQVIPVCTYARFDYELGTALYRTSAHSSSTSPVAQYHILCSYLPTGHDMSSGATGVTSSPHHQSSTATAPVSPQQLLPTGTCTSYVYKLLHLLCLSRQSSKAYGSQSVCMCVNPQKVLDAKRQGTRCWQVFYRCSVIKKELWWS